MSRSAAARSVSCRLVEVPGFTATLIRDGWTDSISLPVGPLGVGGPGVGGAAEANPPLASRSTAAVARPAGRRRVEVFIRSMSRVQLVGSGAAGGRPRIAKEGSERAHDGEPEAHPVRTGLVVGLG